MKNELQKNELQKNELQKNETPQSFLAIVEKVALDPNTNVDKMSKILDMQERILNKQAEIEFNQAMAKAMAEIPSFERSKTISMRSKKTTNVHQYKYTTFESINKVVKPILAKYGLFMTFATDFQQDTRYVLVVAKITHKSGYYQDTSMRFPFDTTGSKNEIQATGSAISYGKRYTMSALLNISTHDEDDDGFATEKTIRSQEISRINSGLEKANIGLDNICKYMGVERLSEIKLNEFNKAVAYINSIIQAKKQ